jgi:prevent-host-death family protein
MKKIVISEFKAKCIAVIREAVRTGEPLIVTRHGKPMVRIEPIASASGKRPLGLLSGRMKINGDLLGPASPEDWEMLQ